MARSTCGHGTTAQRWAASSSATAMPASSLAPQSLHRYAYTENNPIKRTDPSGRTWEDAKKYSAGVVEGMGSLGEAVANLFKKETWETAACGMKRLLYRPDLAWQSAKQNELDPIARGWQFVTSDPSGAGQYLLDHPE